jgi:hypothetical protein
MGQFGTIKSDIHDTSLAAKNMLIFGYEILFQNSMAKNMLIIEFYYRKYAHFRWPKTSLKAVGQRHGRAGRRAIEHRVGCL